MARAIEKNTHTKNAITSEQIHPKLAEMGSKTWNRWAATILADKGPHPEQLLSELKRYKPLDQNEQKNLASNLGVIHFHLIPVDVKFIKYQVNINDFQQFIFPGDVLFLDAVFVRAVSFDEAHFTCGVIFSHVVFKEDTTIQGVKSFGDISFVSCKFSKYTSFTGLNCKTNVHFHDCDNVDEFYFDNCEVHGSTEFNSIAFRSIAHFNGSKFGNKNLPSFKKLDTYMYESGVSFDGSKFEEQLNFMNVYVSQIANFNNVRFCDKSMFSGTEFTLPPTFHGASIHQDTSFLNTVFHQAGSGSLQTLENHKRAWQTLRLAMKDNQNTDYEQMFHKLEMKEKTQLAYGQKENWHAWILSIYKNCSDFGYSLFKPPFWAFVSIMFFSLIYKMFDIPNTLEISIANAFPFSPSSKGVMPEDVGPLFQVVSLLQHAISGIFIFWFALAFKRKLGSK